MTGRPVIDLTGQRFGELTVLYRVTNSSTDQPRPRWLCKCTGNCGGTRKIVSGAHLRDGSTISCGCHRQQILDKTTHGLSKSREYNSWSSMMQRCYDINCTVYEHYGKRGIKVCKRWRHSFENFLADMGPRPKGKTLGRKYNNGDYTPSNCRWETPPQQNGNKSDNVIVTVYGKDMIMAKACRKLGINRHSFSGWYSRSEYNSPQQALAIYAARKGIFL